MGVIKIRNCWYAHMHFYKGYSLKAKSYYIVYLYKFIS